MRATLVAALALLGAGWYWVATGSHVLSIAITGPAPERAAIVASLRVP